MAALPAIDLPERDHYGEFIDVVLGGGKQKCSANFDYAGPLTESVIIGNIAAHFPGETLEFDGRALAFPKQAGGEPVPDADVSPGLARQGVASAFQQSTPSPPLLPAYADHVDLDISEMDISGNHTCRVRNRRTTSHR